MLTGLSRSPTPRQLERCLDELNAGRPQCPVGLYTLVVPRKNNANSGVAPEAQPVVYLNCGHVQVHAYFYCKYMTWALLFILVIGNESIVTNHIFSPSRVNIIGEI